MSIHAGTAHKNGVCSAIDSVDDGMHHLGAVKSFTEWRSKRAHPLQGIETGRSTLPHTYLSCVERLWSQISGKAERGKKLTGFAGDSLFFCKAQKEECQSILQIPKDYQTVFSQQISFAK